MSKNLVRSCVELRLDKNERRKFQKGDKVELLTGDHSRQIVEVLQKPSYNDKDHMLVRAPGQWPYTSVLRVATNEVRHVQAAGNDTGKPARG